MMFEQLKEKRKHNLERIKIERERKAKLQAILDAEIDREAEAVIKERAKREAAARYGMSKHDRRMKSIQTFARGLQGLQKEIQTLNPPKQEKKKERKDPNDFDMNVW
jgi:hypothetical protein